MSNNIRVDKLKAMLQEQPDDSFLNFALGLEYVKMEQYDAALAAFEGIVQRDAQYTGVYYHLGKLYERFGLESKAIATYEAGMEVCKEKKETHNFNELRGALDALL